MTEQSRLDYLLAAVNSPYVGDDDKKEAWKAIARMKDGEEDKRAVRLDALTRNMTVREHNAATLPDSDTASKSAIIRVTIDPAFVAEVEAAIASIAKLKNLADYVTVAGGEK